MTNTLSLWLSAIGFCLVSMTSHSSASECGTLNVGWIDWPPYQYASPDTPQSPEGIDIEAVKKHFGSIGCKLTYTNKPWVRLLKDIESGTLDVLLGASMTEKRKQFSTFTSAYRSETISIFTLKTNNRLLELKKLEDIKGTNIVISYPRNAYLGDIKTLIEDPAYADNFWENIGGERLAMLKHDRHDAVIMDKATGEARIQNSKYKDEIVQNPNIHYNMGEIHFMLRKGLLSDDLMENLNASINNH